jgi:hypothetical protein
MEDNEIVEKLSTPLTQGQAAKISALNHATGSQSALVQAFQLEQRRAAALHGAGSQREQVIASFVTAHQNSLAQTQATARRAQARAPLANPQEYIIYGNVTDPSGAPAPQIDVSAADEKGTILKTDTTGADGSYALHITAAAGHGGHEPYGLGQVFKEVEEFIEGKEDEEKKGAQAQPLGPLKLLASDKKKTFLIQTLAVFQFELGKLANQDLTVPVAAAGK